MVLSRMKCHLHAKFCVLVWRVHGKTQKEARGVSWNSKKDYLYIADFVDYDDNQNDNKPETIWKGPQCLWWCGRWYVIVPTVPRGNKHSCQGSGSRCEYTESFHNICLSIGTAVNKSVTLLNQNTLVGTCNV